MTGVDGQWPHAKYVKDRNSWNRRSIAAAANRGDERRDCGQEPRHRVNHECEIENRHSVLLSVRLMWRDLREGTAGVAAEREGP
jgi:hypothetical protein